MTLPPGLQEALTNFLLFLPSLIVAIVVFVATLVAAGFLRNVVRRSLEKRGVDPQIARLLGSFIRIGILIVGIITALQQVNFDVTAFIAGLGVLGFAAGFALQETMSNFVSGILLLVQQPFKSGDRVEIAGYSGAVVAIELSSTHIKTFDGQDVILPNRSVLGSPIKNMTMSDATRVDLQVGVAYGSDLDKVEKTALDEINKLSYLHPEMSVPFVRFHTFGDSSIDLTVYFWIDAGIILPADARSEAVKLIKSAFDKASIEIPFPIRTVIMEK